MYHKHHTKGIVLKNFEVGDSSKKIQIFTDEFGLITAKVQNARSVNSKMRFGIQEYSFGNFSIVKGKNEWKLVSASSNQNLFEDFKNEKEKLLILLNVLNLIKKLSGEEEQNKKIFYVVENFIKFIKSAESGKLPLVECLVLLKILNIFGYMRNDPDFSIPMSASEINEKDLNIIAPKRAKVVELINESLKMSNLV